MTADEILESIRDRREELAPLVASYVELVEADRKLTETFGRLPASNPRLEKRTRLRVVEVIDTDRAADAEAPYGYKADGTPRKRPGPSAETQAKAALTRARKRRARRREAKRQARLHVQTVTGPTSAEMEDREVVHVTAEPA